VVGKMAKSEKNRMENEAVIWITVMGNSVAAVFNTMWSAVEHEGLAIRHLYCLLDDSHDRIVKNFEDLQEYVIKLATSYNFSPPQIQAVPIEETDFQAIEKTIQSLLFDQDPTVPVLLDMTPGRKYMSGIMMATGIQGKNTLALPNIQRLYYLHLNDFGYKDKLFPLVPFTQQNLYDLLDIQMGTITKKPQIQEEVHEITLDDERTISQPIEIPRNQLMTLLNSLWMEEQRSGRVLSKLGDSPLFEFTLREDGIEITSVATKQTFRTWVAQIKSRIQAMNGNVKTILREIPTYNYFCDVFSRIGYLTEDQTQVVHLVMNKAETALSSPIPFFVAFDTNALNKGVYSILKNQLRRTNRERLKNDRPPIQIKYFVPQEVEKEITKRVNEKLSYAGGRELRKLFYLTHIGNQPQLIARIFQKGSLDLQSLRKEAVSFEGSQPHKKANGDTQIINETRNFVQQQTVYCLLLSNDSSCIQAAKSSKVEAYLWPNRYDFPASFKISWHMFQDLLYQLAWIFVDLRLETQHQATDINGVWLGKQEPDYDKERVRVNSNSTVLQASLDRFLKVL